MSFYEVLWKPSPDLRIISPAICWSGLYRMCASLASIDYANDSDGDMTRRRRWKSASKNSALKSIFPSLRSEYFFSFHLLLNLFLQIIRDIHMASFFFFIRIERNNDKINKAINQEPNSASWLPLILSKTFSIKIQSKREKDREKRERERM